MGLSYADAYDTRALLRRGWGRGEAPYGQKVEPKMRWFLCTIAHSEKYSPAGLLTKDEARRMAASILLKWRWLPFKNCGVSGFIRAEQDNRGTEHCISPKTSTCLAGKPIAGSKLSLCWASIGNGALKRSP